MRGHTTEPLRTPSEHPKREKPSPEETQEGIREENLDRTIEDSFPASDPPSSIPNPDDEEGAA